MGAQLTLDDVLAMHGLGGGLGTSFGNGSDGAFNPAQSTVSGTVTTSTTSYDNVGNVPNTSNASGNGIVAFMLQGAYDNLQIPTIPTANLASATTWSTAATGHSLGVKFTPSTDVTINAFGVAVTTAVSGYVGYLVNDSGVTVATVTLSGNSQSSGYTMFNLSNPVTIPAGKQWEITLYNASNYISVKMSPNGTAVVVNYNNLVAATTYTFTAPTLDGAPVVKQFTSINIPAGVTVTVNQRCKGLIMLCQGDVTINGTVSMDYLGAIADPTDMTNNPAYVSIDTALFKYDPTKPTSQNKTIVIGPGGVGGAGGTGGQSASASSTFAGMGGNPTNGTWWGGGRGGGGGGGACSSGNGSGGRGGDAAYTGSGTPGAAPTTSNGQTGNPGTGGAGGSGQTSSTAYPCGSGGYANGAGGGGGGGATSDSASGQNGANSNGGSGGLILIVAKGNITINSTGQLSAKGSAGANGGNAGFVSGTSFAGGGGGGGGAGGGIIAMLLKGVYNIYGTTNVQGGPGGVGGVQQGASYANGQNGIKGGNGLVQVVGL